jgi:pimeloyl-ACP methyl ester carboxylesterase
MRVEASIARGFLDLVFDLVEITTDLVERTHDSVLERSARRYVPSQPAKEAAKVVTGVHSAISSRVFQSIRAINGVTRFSVNVAAEIAEAAAPEANISEAGVDPSFKSDSCGVAMPIGSPAAGSARWYVDHLQSSINGFWGEYLRRNGSRLDLGMTLRHHGRDLPVTAEDIAAAFPNPSNRVCVFVHGLATTEWLWSLSAQEHYADPAVTFGTRLQEDLGFTPIYLRYNTGRHISENGRALAALLTEVLEAYPVSIDEIALVGHSMGGLVVRSAAHYGAKSDEPWVRPLRHVVCIGSPHLGAPLEKAVNLLTGVLRNVEAAGAQVPAELLDSRSAGVKDLRYGYTVDDEWLGLDPDKVFANARRDLRLVDGVGYYFLAATISRDPNHPLGRLVGDLMVRLPSASGEATEPARRIHFASGAIFPGLHHAHIANHPEVYEALREMLSSGQDSDAHAVTGLLDQA